MSQKKSHAHDAKQGLPQFFRFLVPLIEVLKEMGGNAKSSDVISEIIDRKKPRGAYRASKHLVQIYEAKAFLAKTGYLVSPQRGIWKLTTKGQTQRIRDGDLPDIHSQNKGWRAYWFGEDSFLSDLTPDGSLHRPASQSRWAIPNSSKLRRVKMGINTKKESAIEGRKNEFRLELPNAEKVCLVGDFNGWDIKAQPMRKNEKGHWTKAITVDPGRYEYRFYADGQWLNDPNNPLRCENCFGTENSVLVVLA